jgi:hypothetical protein
MAGAIELTEFLLLSSFGLSLCARELVCDFAYFIICLWALVHNMKINKELDWIIIIIIVAL